MFQLKLNNKKENKKCSTCRRFKPLSSFTRDKKNKDGLKSNCKSCSNIITTTWRKKNPEYKRNYYALNAEKERERSAISRAKDPHKTKARTFIYNSIKAGHLERGICVVCKAKNAEAHHYDYSKPKNVIWLCRNHHSEHHLVIQFIVSLEKFEDKKSKYVDTS